MPDPATDPTPADDEALAEALADEAVEFAISRHPAASPRMRRQIARLYLRFHLHPEVRTTANLATLLGEDRRRLPEIEAVALAKLRRQLRHLLPES